MQFFIEALRANTEVLKGMQADLKEDRKLIADVRERVIRIESNRVDRRVEDLERDVDGLKADKDQRDGATGMVRTILKSPAIGWLVGAAITAWAILTGRVHI